MIRSWYSLLALVLGVRRRSGPRDELLVRPVVGLRPLLGLAEQVLDEDEAPAGLAQGLRRVASADAEHLQSLLAEPAREPCEIAVRGDEHESVESPGVHQVHRVDDERDVGRVLAFRVRKLLVGDEREDRELLLPAPKQRSGEVPVDSPHARLAEGRDLLEDGVCPLRRSVVGVDQHRQSWFVVPGQP